MGLYLYLEDLYLSYSTNSDPTAQHSRADASFRDCQAIWFHLFFIVTFYERFGRCNGEQYLQDQGEIWGKNGLLDLVSFWFGGVLFDNIFSFPTPPLNFSMEYLYY